MFCICMINISHRISQILEISLRYELTHPQSFIADTNPLLYAVIKIAQFLFLLLVVDDFSGYFFFFFLMMTIMSSSATD